MEEKRKSKYETPKIYRVTLKHDQAILSGCHATPATAGSTTGGNCTTVCRRDTGTTTTANSTASS